MKAHITRELEGCNKEDKIGERNLAPLVGGEQKKKNSQVQGSLLCPLNSQNRCWWYMIPAKEYGSSWKKSLPRV